MTEMVWPVGQFWQMEITLRYLLMWHSEIEIVHYWGAFLCCFPASPLRGPYSSYILSCYLMAKLNLLKKYG